MSTPLDPWRPFPVLGGKPVAGAPQTVPWWWIQQFERRIKENHAQTLDQLAARGGLSPGEIWCAFHDKPTREMPKHHVVEWLMVVVPVPSIAPADETLRAYQRDRDAAIDRAQRAERLALDLANGWREEHEARQALDSYGGSPSPMNEEGNALEARFTRALDERKRLLSLPIPPVVR